MRSGRRMRPTRSVRPALEPPPNMARNVMMTTKKSSRFHGSLMYPSRGTMNPYATILSTHSMANTIMKIQSAPSITSCSVASSLYLADSSVRNPDEMTIATMMNGSNHGRSTQYLQNRRTGLDGGSTRKAYVRRVGFFTQPHRSSTPPTLDVAFPTADPTTSAARSAAVFRRALTPSCSAFLNSSSFCRWLSSIASDSSMEAQSLQSESRLCAS